MNILFILFVNKLNNIAMKKTLLLSTILLAVSYLGNAQIKLIGTAANGVGSIKIATWNALEPGTLELTSTDLEAYLFGTSLFNSYSGNYYLNAVGQTTSGLFAFNTLTNEQSITNYSAFSNIAEIDMSTGKIYNMRAVLPDQIIIDEFDINTGIETELGRIIQPGLQGLIADAIGFDSNNGILYHIGFDTQSNGILYAIYVREDVFTYTSTIVTTPFPSNITGLNFDNVTGKLYSLLSEFSLTGNYAATYIAEIGTTSGGVTPLVELEGYDMYLGGSSCYDQNTGTYMIVGFDENFAQKMIAYNTYENTWVTGYVPGTVSEIVCNNYNFARSAYLTTSADELTASDISIYPNPATSRINIRNEKSSNEPIQTEIFSSSGKLMYTGMQTPSTQPGINISAFSPGIYVIKTTAANKTTLHKLIVQ